MASAATAPRPILKSSSRKSSTSSTSSCDSISSSSSSSRHCNVQFSACLSTTYLTHASTDYNRCPIDVTPNALAIPKRGCPGRTYRDEQAALAQFRMESEGRSMPALVSDDGFSSSEESDASIPSPNAYTTSYPIPPSLLKSSRSGHGSRRSKPASSSSRSYGYNSGYSISNAPSFESDGRDDIFGGF